MSYEYTHMSIPIWPKKNYYKQREIVFKMAVKNFASFN